MTQARFCYVVLAHTRTDAVLRLVRRVQQLSPTATVVVRFGPEADLDGRALTDAGAHLVRSAIRTEWGAWSQVEAELEAYRVVRERLDPDYVVVISGQDYPVTDLAAWERGVADRAPDALLSPMPLYEHSHGYTWRIARLPALPGPAHKVAEHLAWRFTQVAGSQVFVNPSPRAGDTRWWLGIRRRRPAQLPTKAASWKTLSRKAIDAVLQSSTTRIAERDVIRSFKCPDELYVPSMVTRAPGLRVDEATTTFAHFQGEAPNPDWLTPDLVAAAVAAGAPFARKLAPDAPSEVLAAADAAASR